MAEFPTTSLSGRSALVCGASMGIGRATALAFAREGADVTILDIQKDAGAETVQMIMESGGSPLNCKDCHIPKKSPKTVSLNHIKEDRKGSIKTEINLLKKLEHPKIVKYIDSIYTEDHLNIVLEYVENGSLDSLIKKFGKIPETLVVIYI